jgi:predicted helicase
MKVPVPVNGSRIWTSASDRVVPKSACSFYYVYGLLHSPQYRSRFAADLKKMLPRIPAATYREQFDAFTHAGRSLSDLHLGYETAKPYPLAETVTGTLDQNDRDTLRVNKMQFKSKTDHSAAMRLPQLGCHTQGRQWGGSS